MAKYYIFHNVARLKSLVYHQDPYATRDISYPQD
jgi:hypothetical protein